MQTRPALVIADHPSLDPFDAAAPVGNWADPPRWPRAALPETSTASDIVGA